MSDVSLRSRFVVGAGWSLAERWIDKLAATAVFAVLANILLPSDFGLVALASVVIAVVQVIQEQGFGQALVQRKMLHDGHLSTIFFLSLCISLITSGVLLLSADVIGELLGDPRLASVLRYLSPTFILAALKTVPVSILKRKLDFKPLAQRTIWSTVVAGILAITLAHIGLGPLALVGQQVVASLVGVFLLWRAVAWRPSMNIAPQHLRDLATFSMYAFGNQLLHVGSRRADDLLIGVALGPELLGLYVIAYKVLLLLTSIIVSTTSAVAMPAFSRIQDDRHRIAAAVYRLTAAVGSIAFPTFVGVAIVAPEIVIVVFGSQWSDSGGVMRILSFIGIAHCLVGLMHAALVGTGYPRSVFMVNLVTLAANLVAFSIGLRWGIAGVATTYVIVGFASVPVSLVVAKSRLGLELGPWVRALGPSVKSVTAMAGAVVAVIAALQSAAASAASVLAVGAAVGVTVYIGCLIVGAPSDVRRSIASARSAFGA